MTPTFAPTDLAAPRLPGQEPVMFVRSSRPHRRSTDDRLDAIEAALAQLLAEVRALGTQMDAEAADTGD